MRLTIAFFYACIKKMSDNATKQAVMLSGGEKWIIPNY